MMLGILLLAGCSADPSGAPVGVDVVTGLVPGPEFGFVVVEAFEPGQPESGLTRLALVEARAAYGQDFLGGRRVAELRLPPGEYRIRARLLRPDGSRLVERSVLGTVEPSGRTVTIALTRDCVGVMCPAPGGSAALSECLGGGCTDPRCEPPDPTFCPEVRFCNRAEDCAPVATCAEQRCIEGLCQTAELAGGCPEGQWCDPDLGCRPLGTSQLTDGGVGAPDGGVVCSTVCVPPGEPCTLGYWRCDVETPFCEPIARRDPGYECGAGQVCDAEGQCVAAP
jgi:hypothetical protein